MTNPSIFFLDDKVPQNSHPYSGNRRHGREVGRRLREYTNVHETRWTRTFRQPCGAVSMTQRRQTT